MRHRKVPLFSWMRAALLCMLMSPFLLIGLVGQEAEPQETAKEDGEGFEIPLEFLPTEIAPPESPKQIEPKKGESTEKKAQAQSEKKDQQKEQQEKEAEEVTFQTTEQEVHELEQSAAKEKKLGLRKVAQVTKFKSTPDLVPSYLVPVLDNLTIETPSFKRNPPGIKNGVLIEGGVLIDGKKCGIKIIYGDPETPLEGRGPKAFSISLTLPQDLKISSFVKDLSYLDPFTLPSATLVVSNFSIQDVASGIKIAAGISLIGEIDLVGPLSMLDALLKELNKTMTVKGTSKAYLMVNVKADKAKTKAKVLIPATFGVDLDQLHKEGKVPSNPYPIKSLALGNLEALLEIGAASKINLDISAGVVFQFFTQEKPIELRGKISTAVTSTGPIFTYSGYMEGFYDPAFGLSWLALGNFGASIEISNNLLLMGIPCPFTGIGFRGGVILGDNKIADKTQIDLSAGISVRDVGAQFLFSGGISQLNISQLVFLLSNAIKVPITMQNIPRVRFSDIYMRLALADMVVAGVRYNQGFALKAGWELGDLKGKASVDISIEKQKIEASGTLAPLYLPNKENPVFVLTGAGPDGVYGTPDDGATIAFTISKEKQKFVLSGDVQLPTLGITHQADLIMGSQLIDGIIKFTVADQRSGATRNLFDGELAMRMNVMDPEDTNFRFYFQQGFVQELNNQVKNSLNTFREDALRKIAEMDQEIGKAQGEIDRAHRDFNAKIAGAQSDINRELDDIDSKLKPLEASCNRKSDIEKVFFKDCWDASILRTRRDFVRAGSGIVQAGQTVVGGVFQAPQQFLDAIKQWEDLKSAAAKTVIVLKDIAEQTSSIITIVDLKEVGGGFTFKDLREGKLPMLNTLKVTFNIPGKAPINIEIKNLQFDFKNPVFSIASIANNIAINLLPALGIPLPAVSK